MSDYPYLVYTDKQNAKIDAETIDSMSGDSGGTGYYIEYQGSSTIVNTNVVYGKPIDKINVSQVNGNRNTIFYYAYSIRSLDLGYTEFFYYSVSGDVMMYITVGPDGPRITTS